MALPTVRDLTDYLRIETEEATAQARLLSALITRATAMLEAWLDRPIETRFAAEFTEEGERDDRPLRRLLVPVTPLDASSVSLTDADGDDVDVATYRVNGLTGELRGLPGVVFPNAPYTVTADVGLATHPEYEARIEPVISAAILDLAADLYHARNPRVAAESAGGGASTSYQPDAIPARVQIALQPYRLVRVV